jgi:hypothetical protein
VEAADRESSSSRWVALQSPQEASIRHTETPSRPRQLLQIAPLSLSIVAEHPQQLDPQVLPLLHLGSSSKGDTRESVPARALMPAPGQATVSSMLIYECQDRVGRFELHLREDQDYPEYPGFTVLRVTRR